jgi:hypothetical protein
MPTRIGTYLNVVPGEGTLRAFLFASAGLLFLFDVAGLLVAGLLTAWLSAPGAGIHYLLVVAALLAAIMLYDQQFGERARRGDWSALARCYLTRFLVFAGGVLVIGGASGVLSTTAPRAVNVWLALSFVLASLARVALATGIHLLTRGGVLAETVAIVGAGSLADRLSQDPGSDTEAFDRGTVGITPLVLDLSRRTAGPRAETLAARVGDLAEYAPHGGT